MKVELSEVASQVDYGVTASASSSAVGPKFLRITDIQDGSVDWEEVPWCECDTRASEAARLRSGDIVFARTGATTGKSYLIRGCPKDAVFASYLIRVRLNQERAWPGYVSHYFQSRDYWNQITRNARGVAQPGVNATTLKSLLIPLPPLSEQKRIAAILDAADALRAKRRESIAQLDTLLQATFLDMFGDPVTNPMGWERKPLQELGKLDRGISRHRPRNDPALLGGPYPLIQTGDVANSGGYIRTFHASYSEIGLKQSKIWPSGTLCITIAANIANTGILTFDACFPDSVVGFASADPCRVKYVQGLFWFFRDILDQRATQVAQKNINLQTLREFLVPAPPQELQLHFANVVDAIEEQRQCCNSHLHDLNTLFASLQARAFSGQL